MIKISKNIMISIFTLLLTLIALGTTTFAWFTLSKTATVSNISANVQAGDGLEVALGIGSFKTSYRNNLRKSDWDELMEQTQFSGFALNAVSTSDALVFHRLAFKNLDDPGITAAGLYKELAVVNKDYLEFTIHFKSNTGGMVKFKDYLFAGDAVNFTPSIKHIVGAAGTTPTDTPFDAYAANAARMAVGSIVVQNSSTSVGNTHTSNVGVSYGQFSYLTEMGNKIYWDSNQLALTDTSISDVIIKEALTEIQTPEIVSILSEDTMLNAFTGSVLIKIWIEGFDADAYDSIFGAKLQIALSFTKE